MVNLNYVQREIKPKEKALAEAQKHCDILKKQLKVKKKGAQRDSDSNGSVVTRKVQKRS